MANEDRTAPKIGFEDVAGAITALLATVADVHAAAHPENKGAWLEVTEIFRRRLRDGHPIKLMLDELKARHG